MHASINRSVAFYFLFRSLSKSNNSCSFIFNLIVIFLHKILSLLRSLLAKFYKQKKRKRYVLYSNITSKKFD